MLELVVGQRFGPFEITGRLGRGGMATVYSVRNAVGQELALKVLELHDDDALARFEREAESHARVDAHPSVLRIHSAGVEAARPYVVMDLAQGGDLAQRLQQGGLPAEEVRSLGQALASGLAHVHACGVLHRDIKPANVLFDQAGRPRLADFGLARPVEATTLTRSGVLLGSPGFMAPEQANAEKAGEASDVFGLAATLYAALAGHAPFRGATLLETLDRTLSGEPPPLPPEVPDNLRAAILRGLAKDPRDRFPSALAFGAALSEGARAPSRLGSRARLIAVSAFGVLLLIGASLHALPRAWVSPTPLATRSSPAPPQAAASSPPATPPPRRMWRRIERSLFQDCRGSAWLSSTRFVTLRRNGLLETYEPNEEGEPVVTQTRRLGRRPPDFTRFVATERYALWGSHQSAVTRLWDRDRGEVDLSPALRLVETVPLQSGRVLLRSSKEIGLWEPGSLNVVLLEPSAQARANERLSIRAVHVVSEEPLTLVVSRAVPKGDQGGAAGSLAPRISVERLGADGQLEQVGEAFKTITVIKALLRVGDQLYAGDELGKILVLAYPRLRLLTALRAKKEEPAHASVVRGIARTRSGVLISLAGRPPELRAWSAEGRLLATRSVPGLQSARYLRLSPDGRFVLVQGYGRTRLLRTPGGD